MGWLPMPMTSKEMIQLLEANGFVYVRQNGSHMLLKNSNTGKTVIVPVHARDLKKGLEQKILKDAGIKKKNWKSIVKDTYTIDEEVWMIG